MLLLVGLILLRFFNPPFTALMVIRALQNGSYSTIRHKWVSLPSLPHHVPRAVVTAEDARFVHHWGIDVREVASALTHGERPRGASTISMQVVKNLFLWPGRSYVRKVIEVTLTPIVELVIGKRRMLELYLNVVEWGPSTFGIEAAALRYFKKPAARLTAHESASLAVILPNPHLLSPFRLPAHRRIQLTRVLHEMSGTELPAY